MVITRTVWPPPSMVDAIMPTLDQAFNNHKLLSEKIRECADFSPVPRALFSHNAYVYERMTDIKTIVTRLLENRRLLNHLVHRQEALRPKVKPGYGKPASKRSQLVWAKYVEVNNKMKLDMESLFIFGNLLLDHWAIVGAYLVGKEQPEDINFFRVADELQGKGDKGLLQPLWVNHHKDILWLLYQIRNYRNNFIEHIRVPWQRGTSMSGNNADFSLGSPAPPDYIGEDEIEKEVNKIRHLAPYWTKSSEWYRKYPRQLLAVTFFYIDDIQEKQQREKVWKVWEKVGGWTCSYDMIAFRSMRFLAESTVTMLGIIAKHPDKIHVGAVPKN
jgi:hypothetical protein